MSERGGMVTARSGGKMHVLAGAHHFRFDNGLPPALTVESGDTVVFECLEAYGGALGPGSTVDDLKRLPFDAVHCLTGPVAVAGAEPGDAVEVEVLEITASQWAWTGVFPGIGVLAEELGPDSWALQIWHVGDDGRAELRPGAGVRVPVEPFCGVMGVALAEPGEHLTMPPRRVGAISTRGTSSLGAGFFCPSRSPARSFRWGTATLPRVMGRCAGRRSRRTSPSGSGSGCTRAARYERRSSKRRGRPRAGWMAWATCPRRPRSRTCAKAWSPLCMTWSSC